MKLFILPEVANLTDRYHCGGGLVVVANDLEAARQLAAQPTDDEWSKAVVYDVHGAEPQVFVFPDAGCC